MGWIVFAAVLALAAGTAPASATVALEISPAAKNEINLGPQSRPGWKPTTEQRQRALKTLQAFLDALESGRHADAYGMLVESFRRQQTLAQFSTETEQFKALAGSAKSWRIVKITWTRDPAQSPQPGTYAALDFSAKFANVDRSCGYFILSRRLGATSPLCAARTTTWTIQTPVKLKRNTARRAWKKCGRRCPRIAPTTIRRTRGRPIR